MLTVSPLSPLSPFSPFSGSSTGSSSSFSSISGSGSSANSSLKSSSELRSINGNAAGDMKLANFFMVVFALRTSYPSSRSFFILPLAESSLLSASASCCMFSATKKSLYLSSLNIDLNRSLRSSKSLVRSLRTSCTSSILGNLFSITSPHIYLRRYQHHVLTSL